MPALSKASKLARRAAKRSRTRTRVTTAERGAPVTRDAAKQRTRDALVAAAHELFASEGLDAPSLDAICERAGYTRGAFYVHFRDRDELLVAVMEKVGAAFLGRLFAAAAADPSAKAEGSALAAVTARFVGALADGTYPLMQAGAPAGEARAPAVRPHQLLDACARSPIVRARYAALVEASIGRLAELALEDQASGHVRSEVGARDLGTILLALVVGAQTLAEIGVPMDPATMARAVLSIMGPGNGRSTD